MQKPLFTLPKFPESRSEGEGQVENKARRRSLIPTSVPLMRLKRIGKIQKIPSFSANVKSSEGSSLWEQTSPAVAKQNQIRQSKNLSLHQQVIRFVNRNSNHSFIIPAEVQNLLYPAQKKLQQVQEHSIYQLPSNSLKVEPADNTVLEIISQRIDSVVDEMPAETNGREKKENILEQILECYEQNDGNNYRIIVHPVQSYSSIIDEEGVKLGTYINLIDSGRRSCSSYSDSFSQSSNSRATNSIHRKREECMSKYEKNAKLKDAQLKDDYKILSPVSKENKKTNRKTKISRQWKLVEKPHIVFKSHPYLNRNNLRQKSIQVYNKQGGGAELPQDRKPPRKSNSSSISALQKQRSSNLSKGNSSCLRA